MNDTDKPKVADFGRRLKAARLAKEWTQDNLRKRSGIPLNMIRMYEQGRSYPGPERLAVLCTILEVPIEQLVPVDWRQHGQESDSGQ